MIVALDDAVLESIMRTAGPSVDERAWCAPRMKLRVYVILHLRLEKRMDSLLRVLQVCGHMRVRAGQICLELWVYKHKMHRVRK